MCDSSSATRIVFSLMTDAPAHSRPLRQRATLFGEVELKPERRALALGALDEDATVVHGLDNVLHQRQPKSGALGHPVVRFDPVELIEHKGEVLGRNPD